MTDAELEQAIVRARDMMSHPHIDNPIAYDFARAVIALHEDNAEWLDEVAMRGKIIDRISPVYEAAVALRAIVLEGARAYPSYDAYASKLAKAGVALANAVDATKPAQEKP